MESFVVSRQNGRQATRMVVLTQAKLVQPAKDEDRQPVIIFVHGLSGSADGTWGDLVRCVRSDEAFARHTLDFYSFPTKLIRLPFAAPLPGLRSIAEGLTTFIQERHGDKQEIWLVAHSLGGLIVRQMVVAELRSSRTLKVTKIALIAVPNNGSMLASVGSLVSFPHRQLKRLSRDDEALRSLNADWEQLKVEELISVRYIVGGCDRAVPHESAVPYVGRENKALLIDADHRSIIRPRDIDDIRYQTVRRFLLESVNPCKVSSPASVMPVAKKPSRAADPLFDAYTPTDDIYYLDRTIDRVVSEALGTGHIWLAGSSGVGKTAVLRRAAYQSGWRLNHINLGGYVISSSIDLFRALAGELSSLLDVTHSQNSGDDFGHCCQNIRSMLLQRPSDTVIANIIEELPVSEDMLEDIAKHAAILIDSLMSDQNLHGRVVFAFSSFKPPKIVSGKIRDKLQMLNMGTWSTYETFQLVELLASALKPELNAEEREKIVIGARGSPRFVKQLFRKWKYQIGPVGPLSELIEKVRLEQV